MHPAWKHAVAIFLRVRANDVLFPLLLVFGVLYLTIPLQISLLNYLDSALQIFVFRSGFVEDPRAPT